jgi:hypothetical protein
MYIQCTGNWIIIFLYRKSLSFNEKIIFNVLGIDKFNLSIKNCSPYYFIIVVCLESFFLINYFTFFNFLLSVILWILNIVVKKGGKEREEN